MKRLTIYLFAASFFALAQECRIVNLTPAQPPLKIEEGERAMESQTFRTTITAVSPDNVVHFFDTANRIRRINSDGRLQTLAGNGLTADSLAPGSPARSTPLPNVTEIAFSPDGALHFVSLGRVWKLANNSLEAVAGSGRPGFNGESAPATAINLGTIVDIAFTSTGDLLIVDGFNRLRRLDPDGFVRTIAGSIRPASANGLTGDGGPATEASLSGPRQVFPLRDGTLWIRDLAGRHLRAISPDGAIRTLNRNFETSINLLPLPDGRPAAGTANRIYPILDNGNLETGAAPYPPFTGTPRAIAADGALYFEGNTRPDQRTPLVKIANNRQQVIAGAPVAALVDGQAAPFGLWNPRTNSLLYASSLDNKTGILEARPGQAPRFIAGGGSDVGEAEGKSATSIAIFGIVSFTLDGQGNLIVADVYRRRILVIGPDGNVSTLKANGEQIVYAPIGVLNNLQRIAADSAGNIYWFQQGNTPTNSAFTADIAVWTRATQSVSVSTVTGLVALSRLEDGSVALIAGNATNFRTAYPASPTQLQGPALPAYRMLPLGSLSRLQGRPYFQAANRLFRGAPGNIEYFEVPTLPSGAAFTPDFLVAASDQLLVHSTDGGFYRIENIDACPWTPQPVITSLVNAASFAFPNTMSPRQLLTIFGSGLGPAEGQGLILDGVLRAGGQPAPFPALFLGNFTGTIPNATLTGTAMPVLFSNDRQVTVQALTATTTANSSNYLLYFTWQGLQLIHPTPIASRAAAPGLFADSSGHALATNNDGSPHSALNPAAPGEVLQLYGTGFGAIDTNLALGDFFPATPVLSTTEKAVTIDDFEAEVTFAGGVPGNLSGLMQLSIRIPTGLAPGPHTLSLTISGQSARPVTIYVKQP